MGSAIIDITKQSSPTDEIKTEPGTIPGGVTAQNIGSPVSNRAYNLIATLHVKLEGLKAYREYAQDAEAELWEELRQHELSTIYKLVDKLEQLMKDGKFFEQPEGPH